MSGHSVIVLDAEAMEILTRTDKVDPRCYDERPDGRFNLRVGGDLRQKMDGFVVKYGLDYSMAIKVMDEYARTRPAPSGSTPTE